jgi:hypothetical protein
MRAPAALLATVALAACGRDYSPPYQPAEGQPASPLGQVIDLEVHLPIALPGSLVGGLHLEISLGLDEVGPGKHEARVSYGVAHHDWSRTPVVVEDLGSGITTLFVTDEHWTTGRLGPLRIDSTVFELLLDGTPERGGRHVTGRTWDSLTGLEGSFEAWRQHRFLVAGTDYFSSFGSLSEVVLVKERQIVVRNGLEITSSDPVLYAGGGAALVINRLTFDNLQRLDPQQEFATGWQAGVGAGSNPHGVAVLDAEKAYVTRYEPPFDDVAVFDPESGRILESIPLESLAENPDGTPRADSLVLADGTLFVALQDIDRTFTKFAEGKLAVIDPVQDEIAGVIPLGGLNPWAIEPLTGADGKLRIYVSLAGIFPGLQQQSLSGGVVVVDAGARVLERWALDDDVVGANFGDLAMHSEALGYVVASDASFQNRVLAFDPASGALRRTVFESFDHVNEIEVDGDGILAIPDRSFFQPALCLYRIAADPAEAEALIGCGSLDLPPFSLEALD